MGSLWIERWGQPLACIHGVADTGLRGRPLVDSPDGQYRPRQASVTPDLLDHIYSPKIEAMHDYMVGLRKSLPILDEADRHIQNFELA